MKPKHKHLTYAHRKQIEALLKAHVSKVEISRIIGCCISTLYNELRRGNVQQIRRLELNPYYVYSADAAQRKYEIGQAQKGAPEKVCDPDFFDYVESEIRTRKYSPYAALESARSNGYAVCSLSTLYNYIRARKFKQLRLVHCPAHCNYKPRKTVKIIKSPKGRSIETRSISRNSIGHWEMDTVIGKTEKGACLLVLTERNTRYEIVRKIPSKTQQAVAQALDALEQTYKQKFPKMFKTITMDNGCEFIGQTKIEKSCRRKASRTTAYYCHPYSSFERGSNENANRLIRRHIPKGISISQYTHEEIQEVQDWINEYPRKLHGGRTAKEMFYEKFSEFF